MSANGWKGASQVQDPHYFYETDQATHFTGAIAIGAIANENHIVFPCRSVLITNITIVSQQPIGFAVYFWGDSNYNAGLANSAFIARINFDITMVTQIGGAGYFFSSFSGLPGLTELAVSPFPIPYTHLPSAAAAPGHLYWGISPISGGLAKLASGAGGNVSIKIFYTPMG
jgi:hypothetical protein